MRVHFSNPYLKSLKPDPAGQLDILDETPPHPSVGGHLGIRVGKRKKSWFIRYNFNGKRRRHFFGHYPAISLKDARAIAAEKFNQIYHGTDPQEERNSYRKSPTMNDLWDEYLKFVKRTDTQKAKAGKKPKPESSKRWDESNWNRNIKPTLGKQKLVDIKRSDIAQLLERIASKAPTTANRTHSQLSVMFGRALDLGFLDVHPMYRLRKPVQEFPRTRFLSRDEIKLVWKYLPYLREDYSDIVELLLLTGQRSGEVMSMKWADLYFEDRLWVQNENKSDRPHQLPLSDRIYEILYRRQNNSDWVFPARSKYGHVAFINDATNKLIELSKIPHFTPHDLRRTHRTLQSEIGTPDIVAERILNHSLSGIIKVYNMHSYVPEMRKALDLLASEVYALTQEDK